MRSICDPNEAGSRNGGFTLIEIMLAVLILSFILTAVVVSVRGKWQAEQARRGAQTVVMAWIKARSYAWREGRDWVVLWDPKTSRLSGMPMPSSQGLEVPPEDAGNDKASLRAFTMDLDRSVKLAPESKEEDLPMVRFLPNGRVRHTSLLVKSTRGDVWRVRTDWDGYPILESVNSQAKGSGSP